MGGTGKKKGKPLFCLWRATAVPTQNFLVDYLFGRGGLNWILGRIFGMDGFFPTGCSPTKCWKILGGKAEKAQMGLLS